jgi:hypothetical protein
LHAQIRLRRGAIHSLSATVVGSSQFGLAHAVECPSKIEPFIAIRRAGGPLHVRATLRGEQWIFTWGHGRGRWVGAYDVDAATRVWEVAR